MPIENMTETWGSGWWDDAPWRFVFKDDTDYVHIGEPQATREEAEADYAQYMEQLA